MNFGKHSSCMQYHLIWCHVVVIQYPVDSYPFRPMAIGPPIPITNIMVKIRGQNVCLTSCLNSLSSNISFLRFDYLEVSHWKYKVKVAKEVKVQGRIGGPTSYQPSSLLFQVSRFYHSWFQNLTVKSQCQGLVQGFTLSMYVIDSFSINANQTSHSWDTALSKFELVPRSVPGARVMASRMWTHLTKSTQLILLNTLQLSMWRIPRNVMLSLPGNT